MLKVLLAAMFSCASQQCLADEFNIEDPSLGDPPAGVQSAIRADASFAAYQRCVIAGKPIRLSASPGKNYFAVTTANACNWGAALGPIWVVSFDATHDKVILADGGASVTVGAHLHHGLRDLTISTGTAGRYEEQHWQFNGRQYAKVTAYVGPPR